MTTARPAAQHRLRGLEAIEDESTIRLLAELGVTSGWHCLEIGAGRGLHRAMARRLGYDRPAGSVATDINTHLLDTAAYEVWGARHSSG